MIRNRHAGLTLLLVVGLAGCLTEFKPSNPYDAAMPIEQQQPGRIVGEVTLEGGGTREGVLITAGTETATTDVEGAFSVGGLEPGFYNLTISNDGFETLSISSIGVTVGSQTELPTVQLVLARGSVSGTVSLADSDASGGVLVELTDGAVAYTTGTDASGAYSINGVPEGIFSLSAKRDGYLQAGHDVVTVTGGAALEVESIILSPFAGTLVLAGGANWATTRLVDVAIAADGATSMRLWQSSTQADTEWRDYNAATTFALEGDEGDEQVVYAQLRDANGNSTQVVYDAIALDTIAPVPATQALILGQANDELTFTNSLSLPLSLGASEADEMQVSVCDNTIITAPLCNTGTWVAFSNSALALLPPGDCQSVGCKEVQVQFRDFAGNQSEVVTANITLDATPPEPPHFQTESFVVNIRDDDGDDDSRLINGVALYRVRLFKEVADTFFHSYEILGAPDVYDDFETVEDDQSTPDNVDFFVRIAQGSTTGERPYLNRAINNIRLRARDRAGNLSAETNIVIIEDSSPPPAPLLRTTPQVVNADTFTVKLKPLCRAPTRPHLLSIDGTGDGGATGVNVGIGGVLDEEIVCDDFEDATFSHYELRGGGYTSPTAVTAVDNFSFDLNEGDGGDRNCLCANDANGQLPAINTDLCSNNLKVRAVDAAGNMSGWAAVAICEDSVEPGQPEIVTQEATVNADSVSLFFETYADDNSGVSYEIRDPADVWHQVSLNDPRVQERDGRPWAVTVGLRPDSDNLFLVRAVDAAGNRGLETEELIHEQSTRLAVSNPLPSRAPDVYGDYVAYRYRAGVDAKDAVHLLNLRTGDDQSISTPGALNEPFLSDDVRTGPVIRGRSVFWSDSLGRVLFYDIAEGAASVVRSHTPDAIVDGTPRCDVEQSRRVSVAGEVASDGISVVFVDGDMVDQSGACVDSETEAVGFSSFGYCEQASNCAWDQDAMDYFEPRAHLSEVAWLPSPRLSCRRALVQAVVNDGSGGISYRLLLFNLGRDVIDNPQSPTLSNPRLLHESPSPIQTALTCRFAVWQAQGSEDVQVMDIARIDSLGVAQTRTLSPAPALENATASESKLVYLAKAPCESPDCNAAEQVLQVWQYDLNRGGAPGIVSRSDVAQSSPSVSGQRVVWVDARAGVEGIYVNDLVTTKWLAIGGDSQGDASVRGHTVSYIHSGASSSTLVTVDLNTGSFEDVGVEGAFVGGADQVALADSDGDSIGSTLVFTPGDDSSGDSGLTWASPQDGAEGAAGGLGDGEIGATAPVSSLDVDGRGLVWSEDNGLGGSAIFAFEMGSGDAPMKLTGSAAANARPRISGKLVVWVDGDGSIMSCRVCLPGDDGPCPGNNDVGECLLGGTVLASLEPGGQLLNPDLTEHTLLRDRGLVAWANFQSREIEGVFITPETGMALPGHPVFSLSTSQADATGDYYEARNPGVGERYVAWEDARNGNWDIFVYHISSATQLQLTDDPSSQLGAKVYRRQVVWTDYRFGSADVFYWRQ